MSETLNAFPKGLSSIQIAILNDSSWWGDKNTIEVYKDTDVLTLPLEIQAHSSLKVRVALRLSYKSRIELANAYGIFANLDGKNNVMEPKVSLQFTTSTSKMTEPIEFKCFSDSLYILDQKILTPMP